jgi:hypothetical protein
LAFSSAGIDMGTYERKIIGGVCGGQGTAEGGRKFIYLGCRLVLRDKKIKDS